MWGERSAGAGAGRARQPGPGLGGPSGGGRRAPAARPCPPPTSAPRPASSAAGPRGRRPILSPPSPAGIQEPRCTAVAAPARPAARAGGSRPRRPRARPAPRCREHRPLQDRQRPARRRRHRRLVLRRRHVPPRGAPRPALRPANLGLLRSSVEGKGHLVLPRGGRASTPSGGPSARSPRGSRLTRNTTAGHTLNSGVA